MSLAAAGFKAFICAILMFYLLGLIFKIVGL